jgi:uncharacterized protein (TIGR03435 family)
MAINAQGVTMQRFATSLARHLNQPVTDKTGLDGVYTFRLEYATDGDSPGAMSAELKADGAPQLSIFSALPSQLGLKLESQKLGASIVVIDHVNRVAGNN